MITFANWAQTIFVFGLAACFSVQADPTAKPLLDSNNLTSTLFYNYTERVGLTAPNTIANLWLPASNVQDSEKSNDSGLGVDHANASTTRRPFFGDIWYHVFHIYAPVHGYLSISICIMGIIANILNIIILKR